MKCRNDQFEPYAVNLAFIAKALAHPARIRILEILMEKKTCPCGSIVDVIPLAQSTVSQHLKMLIDSGLIQGKAAGMRTCYCVNKEAFEKAAEGFGDWFSGVNNFSLKKGNTSRD